ncbi:MAG: glycosyltransferase family 4 protein [Terracidiphilus sp.]|jgi:glycosyltransferase involved in cell wall biosynthesis
MRICIVAENASTRFGGEAILPVHYFRLLRSRGIECWMVVHSRTQNEVTELFPNDIGRILFIPDLWIHKLVFRLSRYLPRRLSEATLGLVIQLITQFCQRSVVRRLIREQRINVVHQPIPVAPRFPSAMFGLGVPVVIGPLNGGMEYPPAFRRAESSMSRSAVAFARLFANAGNMLLPGKRQASVVLVANERTRRALPAGIRGKVIELPENGIDIGVWQGEHGTAQGTAPRFVFLGRLVDWKAADIAIRSLETVPSAELELIGDGPMLETWRSLAVDLGLKDRVHFSGWLSQKECAAHLLNSVALVLPSLYECGGAVVLEAMAMGKPVIATRWGGPADYLDASCGVLVDPASYEGLVTGFANAMQSMLESPDLAKRIGAAGRERAVRDFDWQLKIDRVIGIYRSVAEKTEVFQEAKQAAVSPAAASKSN